MGDSSPIIDSPNPVDLNQCGFRQTRTARDKKTVLTYFCILDKHPGIIHKFDESHTLEADVSHLFKK
jgi:hypothetical protein